MQPSSAPKQTPFSRAWQTLWSAWAAALRPRKRLSLSAWTEAYRVLPDTAVHRGPWRLDRAPYQVEIMDALTSPGVHLVVAKKSSQTGLTEVANNLIGYCVEHAPTTIMVVHPTVEMGRAWSTKKLAPMFSDTPTLRDQVVEARGKNAGGTNSTLEKRYRSGAELAVAGASSPNGISQRTVRVVIQDDIDRFPGVVGEDGDPCYVASRRNTTFPDKLEFRISTPTVASTSRITADYEQSSRGRWHVRCPRCAAEQPLVWEQVRWPAEGSTDDKARAARYHCDSCGEAWTEAERQAAIKGGRWIHERPEHPVRGFHVSQLMVQAPLANLPDMVTGWIRASRIGPTAQRVWVNTVLGEAWEEQGERADPEILHRTRREHYGELLDPRVLAITAGVDVQRDRLECEVVGWSQEEESWSLAYLVLYGDPQARTETTVWDDLDEALSRTWPHPSGWELPILACAVDSGDRTDDVYAYCRPRSTGIAPTANLPRGAPSTRVYAIKAEEGQGLPHVIKSTRPKGKRIRLWHLSRHTGLDRLHADLSVEEEGPCYCHFPWDREPAYFEGLAASQLVTVTRQGAHVQVWRPRRVTQPQEPQDARRYARAALAIRAPSWHVLAERYSMAPEDDGEEDPEPTPTATTARPGGGRGRGRGGGYRPGGWRR